ncbi:MAG: hypothetical protein ATN31_00760 [Candidatus Epulonipiscioides saccharophilum]|nr:MAG: hypothetical protein ATN31_00760 [Epulopiscium sp. AS2M-Bin001]
MLEDMIMLEMIFEALGDVGEAMFEAVGDVGEIILYMGYGVVTIMGLTIILLILSILLTIIRMFRRY